MTGSQFERMAVAMLANNGYWAHRIAPDTRGAQPFDIIAVGGGNVIVADCKVCQSGRFQIQRFEENQRTSFEFFRIRNNDCDNVRIGIFAWYDSNVYWIPYYVLLEEKSIKLTEELLCKRQLGLTL